MKAKWIESIEKLEIDCSTDNYVNFVTLTKEEAGLLFRLLRSLNERGEI